MTVEFLQPVFPVDEDQENVSVCLTIDSPTATPLTVSVEATSLSADGKVVCPLSLHVHSRMMYLFCSLYYIENSCTVVSVC